MIALAKSSKITISSICLITICLLNACTLYTGTSDATKASSDSKAQEKSEMQTPITVTTAEVYDVTLKEGSLRFLTKSNGCTTAQNFALMVAPSLKGDTDTTKVTINLLKPDYCKGMTRIVAIEIPLNIANEDSVIITNPKLSAPKINKPKR